MYRVQYLILPIKVELRDLSTEKKLSMGKDRVIEEIFGWEIFQNNVGGP